MTAWKRNITLLLCLVALTALTSCGVKKYHSDQQFANFPLGGYSDKPLNKNTVMVSYSGSTRLPRSKLNAYLIYRCAQVTIKNGYDYFVVASSSLSPVDINVREQMSEQIINPPLLYKTYDTLNYEGNTKSVSAFPNPGKPTSEPEATSAVAVIKMFNGRKPANLPNSYKAVDVLGQLGPSTL